MKKIDIWFHCWCGNNSHPISSLRLLKILNDKFNKFKKSGLYDNTSNIFVVASQISSKNEFIFDEIQNMYSKVKLIKLPVPKIGNECDTLNLMIDHYKNINDSYNIFYCHTKGLKYPENSPIANRMIKWTRYMDWFLIKEWKSSQETLVDYDTNGIFLFKPGEDSRKADEPDDRKTYAGHFWWSKSEYIKKLDFISKNYQKSRGEFHLLDHPEVKYHMIPTDWLNLGPIDFHVDDTDDEHLFPEGW